jgi:phospho-N-acetylmuramoyl-pentapeptide-transferase
VLMIFLDFLRWYFERSGESGDLGPLRVFRFITVRAGAALILAFVLSLVFGPRMIERLRGLGTGQVVRGTTKQGAISLLEMHGAKQGTPSMGGLMIMAAMFTSVLLFCRLSSSYVLLLSLVALSFAAVGFVDDYRKITRRNHLGLSPRGKLVAQAAIGLALGLILWLGSWRIFYEPTGDAGYAHLLVPFFKDLYPAIGILFVLLAVAVMVCTSNAVNLTDGLDGLAAGVTLASTAAFTVMAYLACHVHLSSYLFIPHVAGGGEIVVFGGALFGATLGFLWFNSHPAELFMGDTGSMMLGGTLGAIALMIKQELLLVLIGGVFVVEALSVIIQVISFKTTGRRVFRMSPLHHHYEKLGLHESKIIIRFWTISLLLALLGIATLKLR